MKDVEIRRYAALLHELNLTALEINESKQMVRLERQAESSAPSASERIDKSALIDVAEGPVLKEVSNEDCCVTSPIVGVFYTAPAENAAPFVAVGDSVKKGETLCIIEAMKLMNEIVAEQDGVITAVCAENGQLVEFGSPLFYIKEA